MNKFKAWLKSKQGKVCMVLSALAVTMVPFASAAEGDATAAIDSTAIQGAFTSGLNGLVTTSISILSAILPIAISFFAVKWVCVKGTSWFKSMAK